MIPLFDELLFTGKPSAETLGITPLTVVYQQNILTQPGDGFPTQGEINTRFAAYAASTDLICLDVEAHWSLSSQAAAEADAALLVDLIGMCRIACPNAQFAYYSGGAPNRNYFGAVALDGAAGYETWQTQNDWYQPVANAVDAMFPSLYTFYPNESQNLTYMRENIREARRLNPNVPCYPFIWPQYHDSNVGMVGQFIPYRYWYRILDQCAKWADGAVLWGGFGVQWSLASALPWWQATQDFMNRTEVPVRWTK